MAAAARERNATAKSGPVFRRRVTLVARLVDRAAGMALDTLMGVPRRARRLFVTVGVLVALVGLALAACTVKAPPAPQSTDTPRNSAPREEPSSRRSRRSPARSHRPDGLGAEPFVDEQRQRGDIK